MMHTKDVSNWEHVVSNRVWGEMTEPRYANAENDDNDEYKDDTCNEPQPQTTSV